jgi:excisionase family DNA binding protein
MPAKLTLTPTHAASLLSVEQVAEILTLNVRTVRNYVRSGRLKATRIGKQYRIGLADLETFTGRPVESHDPRTPAPGGRVEISSVINVEGVTSELASRIANTLMATANMLRSFERSVAVSTTYDVQLDRMRVLLAADLATTRDFLGLISAVLEPPAAPASAAAGQVAV